MTESGQVPPTMESVVVGEELGPVEYDLTENEVAAFADRIENMSVERLTLSDGRRAAPPTIIGGDYVKVLRTRYGGGDTGPVHTHAKYRFLRPIVPPLHIVVTGKVIDKYIRRGREYLVVRTVTSDGEGNELAHGENTWWMNISVHHEETESEAGGDSRN